MRHVIAALFLFALSAAACTDPLVPLRQRDAGAGPTFAARIDAGAPSTIPHDAGAAYDAGASARNDAGAASHPGDGGSAAIHGADAGPAPCVGGATAGCCHRDIDCGPTDYCTNAGRCVRLTYPTAGPCPRGVTQIGDGCKGEDTETGFVACAGQPGPADCPYCSGGACYQTGFCATSSDCHGGEACVRGLCEPVGDPCGVIVDIDDIRAGRFSPGKHVCVRGTTTIVVPAFDGDTHVQLGISGGFGFTTEVTPPYQGRIGNPPALRQTSVYGAVRWDPAHNWWEVHPIFWWR